MSINSVFSQSNPFIADTPNTGEIANSFRPPNIDSEANAPSASAAPSTPPTAGARDATKPTDDGYGKLDPAAAQKKAEYDALVQHQRGFAMIDACQGWRNDGVIELWDLEEIVKNTSLPEEARAAAQYLMDNPQIWQALARMNVEDNRATIKDMSDFIANLKAEVDETCAAKSSAATPASESTPGTGSNAAADLGSPAVKPPPSRLAGFEGATENLENMVRWSEDEIDRLTLLMSRTEDPKVKAELQTKINQLTRQVQQVAALLNQLMTMMANISKMYSDIAMNSVRHIQ